MYVILYVWLALPSKYQGASTRAKIKPLYILCTSSIFYIYIIFIYLVLASLSTILFLSYYTFMSPPHYNNSSLKNTCYYISAIQAPASWRWSLRFYTSSTSLFFSVIYIMAMLTISRILSELILSFRSHKARDSSAALRRLRSIYIMYADNYYTQVSPSTRN